VTDADDEKAADCNSEPSQVWAMLSRRLMNLSFVLRFGERGGDFTSRGTSAASTTM